MYIVFEGGEGSGKSSASRDALDRLRLMYPDRDFRWVREPGGVTWAEKVRDLIFSSESDGVIEAEEEILLFAAARVNLIRQVRKMESEGCVVLSDRNVWSSLAYQATMSPQHAELITAMNGGLVKDIRPWVVFFFDVAPEIGLERAALRKVGNNRNDEKPIEFHREVYARYQDLADRRVFCQHVERIDASRPYDEVIEDVMQRLLYWLK